MPGDYGPHMTTRPAPLLLGTVLTGTIGVGAGLFGAFFLAIAAGAIGFFGPVGFLSLAGLVGAASVLYGVVAIAAAAGMWAHRSWAWPIAATVALIALAGTLTAAFTGGFGSHIVVGILLGVGGLAALAAPATRESLVA